MATGEHVGGAVTVPSDKCPGDGQRPVRHAMNNLESSTSAIRIGVSGRRGLALRSWNIANCLRRKRFSAAGVICGRRVSQNNVARSPSCVIIVLTPSMAGSILPYHLRLRDSKVTSSLRINKIQLLRTTGIQILLLRIQPRLGGILEYRHLSILRRSCLTKGLLQRSIIVCNVFQTHRP